MQKAETQIKNINIKKNDVNILILSEENEPNLLGLTLTQWLIKACTKYEHKVIFKPDKTSETEVILNNLTNASITLVLHSATPLVTSENIDFYIDYLNYKQLELVAFPQGFIFNTQYIKRTQSFKEPVFFNGVNNEFVAVTNKQSENYVAGVLNERIIEKHIKNGVTFVDECSVIIHEQVEIEKGVSIWPFNLITGNTFVGKNAMLKEGNTLNNAYIAEGAVVAKSVINNSHIGKNSIICPFNTINNSQISENCNIKSYNNIEHCTVGENTTIESFNSIGN